jgi:hypothetical protein
LDLIPNRLDGRIDIVAAVHSATNGFRRRNKVGSSDIKREFCNLGGVVTLIIWRASRFL